MTGDCWTLLIGIAILSAAVGYCNGRLHELAKCDHVRNTDTEKAQREEESA
jgi:hypothetical protein